MDKQLDRIEKMLRYLIIKPKLEWLEKHFQNYNQLSQQTNVPPPIPGMYEELNQLRVLLPDIDGIIFGKVEERSER